MKLKAIFAAAALAIAGTAYAAEGMDCCKDGKCTCCDHKDGEAHKDMKR